MLHILCTCKRKIAVKTAMKTDRVLLILRYWSQNNNTKKKIAKTEKYVDVATLPVTQTIRICITKHH